MIPSGLVDKRRAITVNVAGHVLGTLYVAGGDLTIQQTIQLPGPHWKRPDEADPRRLWERAVGRRAELGELHQRLQAHPETAITAAVAGMAGVGKSTLASLYRHQHGAEFGGGVVWAELGFNFRSAERCQPILDRWAGYAYGGDILVTQLIRQAAGRAEAEVRLDPTGVAALLSGHGPLLAVLDDVWDIEAIQPLRRALPDDARILATTRDTRIARQLGLMELPVLTPDDALELLRRHLDDLPDDLLRKLAEGLGRHAQALDIAARSLATRAGVRRRTDGVADLLGRVKRGEGFGGLPMTDDYNPEKDVEIALKFSYDDLDGEHQRRFRALGAFAPPQSDFSTEAAAAVWGGQDGPDQAAGFLETFAARSLVTSLEAERPGRWAQHAILRAYALGLLEREGEAAWARGLHLTHYQRQAEYWIGEKLDVSPLDPDLAQYQHAFRWARDHEPGRLVDFVVAAYQFLSLRHYRRDLHEWLDEALRVAVARGDKRGEANTLKALGDLDVREDQYPSARQHYEQALELCRAIPDRLGEANTLRALGDLDVREDQYPSARQHYEQALELYRAIPARLGEANTLQALGDLDVLEAQYPSARQHYEQALELYRAIPDRVGEAHTRRALGDLERLQGNFDAAAAFFQQAADLYHTIGSLRDEAVMKAMFAQLRLDQGQPREAVRLMWEALQFFEARDLPGDIRVTRHILRGFAGRIPGFAALWQEVSGQPLPGWLSASPRRPLPP